MIEIKGKKESCVFAGLDGMYSYCFVESDPSIVFHLKRDTPLVEVNGRWEIVHSSKTN